MIRLAVFVLMCPKVSRRKFGSVSTTKKTIKMFQRKAVMIAQKNSKDVGCQEEPNAPRTHVHLLDPADTRGCGIVHNDLMHLRLLPFSTFVDRIRE